MYASVYFETWEQEVEVLGKLAFPEVDEGEVSEIALVEVEVEIEDEGLEMEITELLEKVELLEQSSSSRIILSSTSPCCSCSATSLIFWANSDLAPFLSS